MKLSIGLVVAVAHATEKVTNGSSHRVQRSTHTEWMVNTWWEEAVDVFNFSHDNFAAFDAAVNSVSFAFIFLLVYSFQVPEDMWKPVWEFCDTDDTAESLTADELTVCAAKAADYFGMPDAHKSFLYSFASKYWSVVDTDNSGCLCKDEWRRALGAFAATDAGVIMSAFDADDDGMLDTAELAKWQATVEGMFESWGWNPSDGVKACISDAWKAADRECFFALLLIK